MRFCMARPSGVSWIIWPRPSPGQAIRSTRPAASILSRRRERLYWATRSSFSSSTGRIRRPPSQDRKDEGRYRISEEKLREVGGDIILVWINSGDGVDDAAARVAQIEAHPLWLQLPAVRQGKVYHVAGHWVGQSILDANLVLDDLFKGMLGEKPA